MLMVMEPIWESDFHRLSYGFRPARSVHRAIRTVNPPLQDGGEQSVAGHWVIQGDLAPLGHIHLCWGEGPACLEDVGLGTRPSWEQSSL